MHRQKDALPVMVVGGGLAGSEAAFQLAARGFQVELHEMRLGCGNTPAHRTHRLGELVCSNSLKSVDPLTSAGMLKQELSMMESFLLRVAFSTRVPAGNALAVDRNRFAEEITKELSSLSRVRLVEREVEEISPEAPTIIASGPLTSAALSMHLQDIFGEDNLSFYDAISPIIAGDSIERSRTFLAARYGKGGDDYLNCPFDAAEYERFHEALVAADLTSRRAFEDARYFEACLPVEVIAARGKDALRFGPMRPVGLSLPGSGKRPHAVVQLRREDAHGTMWNMVGFQTRLTYTEQARIFRMIPGLGRAGFLRYGSIHRNTFVNTPAVLTDFFQPRKSSWEKVFLAGQLTGVEGYVESIASGILAAGNLARLLHGQEPVLPPDTTMTGALFRHVGCADPRHFQPMNVNMGLLPPYGSTRGKEKKMRQAERALRDMRDWVREVNW
jgi:methylenetetrahydrofolate--tRNA-(uracil-5-)-methyltransferase